MESSNGRPCGECAHFSKAQHEWKCQGWGHCLCPLPASAEIYGKDDAGEIAEFPVHESLYPYSDCGQFEPVACATFDLEDVGYPSDRRQEADLNVAMGARHRRSEQAADCGQFEEVERGK